VNCFINQVWQLTADYGGEKLGYISQCYKIASHLKEIPLKKEVNLILNILP